MKIKLLSDLHMEGKYFKYKNHGEEVIFLVGDIHTRNRHYDLLDQIPKDIEIYIVAGNHEYYNKEFNAVNKYLESLSTPDIIGNCYPNVTFLNNKAAWLKDGTAVFGGTMFTDFELDGLTNQWFAEHDASRFIADFAYIHTIGKHYEQRRWTIQDHKEQHEIFKKELRAWLTATEGKRRIVATHFMPTRHSVHPRFDNSNLNPYFTADMTPFMGWEGFWFHGHGHDTFDYMIEETRVLANPRGYGLENLGGFKEDFILEI